MSPGIQHKVAIATAETPGLRVNATFAQQALTKAMTAVHAAKISAATQTASASAAPMIATTTPATCLASLAEMKLAIRAKSGTANYSGCVIAGRLKDEIPCSQRWEDSAFFRWHFFL